MRRAFMLCLVLVAMLGLVLPASAQSQWVLAWSDEFNDAAGTPPSSANWTFEQGNNSGWGNGEKEYYCAPGGSGQQYCDYAHPNVYQDGNGNLVVEARLESSGKWTSGRMKTSKLQDFTYGRIEARMQLPNNCTPNGTLCTGLQGIWPAFWMMGDNGVTWPGNGELDIMEQIGKQPTIINGTLHGIGYANGMGKPYSLPDNSYFGSTFHTFGMIWSANEIKFYVDDPSNVYATYTADDIATYSGDTHYPAEWDFIGHQFYILFNLAVGGTWPGAPDATTVSPQTMLVDYVRVYRWVDKPTAPVLTAAPVSNSQIQLNWTASTSTDPNITYNVFRSGQAGTKNTPANWITNQVKGTTFVDTMLTPGANYCYVVTASGENAPESDLSNEVCTTPGAGTNILPIAITAGGTAGSDRWIRETGFSGATLTSTNSVNQSIDTTGVAYPAPQGVYRTERWGPQVWTIPSLTPGTNYLVRLHFLESAQTGPNKRFFNVSLVNTANSASTPLLTQFDIYAAAGAQFKAVTKEFSVPADPNGSIQLNFTKGTGGSSQNPSLRGIEVIPFPASATNLIATPVTGSVNLTWTAGSAGCPVTYNVFRATTSGFTPSGANQVASLSGLSFADTTVAPSTNYYYLVQTVGCNGAAVLSNEASVTSRPAISADSVSPNGGVGNPGQNLVFRYSDAQGYAAITFVQGIINWGISYDNSCSFQYVPATQLIYLSSGSGWGTPKVLGSTGVLTNPQCTIDVGRSSASGSGTELTLSLAVSFNDGFLNTVGTRNIYGLAADTNSRSVWQMLGTWTPSTTIISNQPPSADAVTPNNATGPQQILTFQYSDVNGYTYIDWVQGIINANAAYKNSCSFYLDRNTMGLRLQNDAGTAWLAPIKIGTPGTLSNAQCSIDVGASSASGNGNTLTVNLAVTASPTWIGPQTILALAKDHVGAQSGWKSLGTWTANPVQAIPPAVVSVTPNAATTGAPATLSFNFSDVNGANYVGWVQAIVNTSVNYAGGCAVYYNVTNNNLYLQPDSGTSWGTPVRLGTSGTLSNSQCSINAGASSVSSSGNDLTLNLSVTFSAGSAGVWNVFGFAQDLSGLRSGWSQMGTITIQ